MKATASDAGGSGLAANHLDISARDQRMVRAVGDVLKSYNIREASAQKRSSAQGAAPVPLFGPDPNQPTSRRRAASRKEAASQKGASGEACTGKLQPHSTSGPESTAKREGESQGAGLAHSPITFTVTAKDGHGYEVCVHPMWNAAPSCTCPDFARNAASGSSTWCKHVIAVLMSREELRCQLLDLYV